MVDDAIRAETPSAASPATDQAVREIEVLSGLTELALEMARGFQAQAIAALAAGDVDGAGKAETRFSALFLGIRRAVALKAKWHRQREEQAAASLAADEADAAMLSELMELALALAGAVQAWALAALAAGDLDSARDAETRFSGLFVGVRRTIALKARLRRQRQEAQAAAEFRRKTRQDEKDDRRHAVAQGVARAIAAAPDTDAEAKERLTVELWERLTEDDRIDVDLADTVLPIETLIASLCRALGIPPRWPPPAGGSAAATKAGADEAGPKGPNSGPASRRAASSHCQSIPAEDVGGPEGERSIHTVATGQIFNWNRGLDPTLPEDDRPPGDTGPPAGARSGSDPPVAPMDRRRAGRAPPRDRTRRPVAPPAEARPQLPGDRPMAVAGRQRAEPLRQQTPQHIAAQPRAPPARVPQDTPDLSPQAIPIEQPAIPRPAPGRPDAPKCGAPATEG